jgi:hypothetical protein
MFHIEEDSSQKTQKRHKVHNAIRRVPFCALCVFLCAFCGESSLFEYTGSHTLGRAETQRGFPCRDGHRIARPDEGSTRRAADHLRTGYPLSADLFAQVLKILDSAAQTIAEARYRFDDVDDEGEYQKDQNAAKDKVQRLPPGL